MPSPAHQRFRAAFGKNPPSRVSQAGPPDSTGKISEVSGKSIDELSGKRALHNVAVELAISPRAEAAIGRRRVALQK